ncbi:UDPGP type 1 family protein [Pirellulaceae bacterium]|nr:UDPGP type 1 family protein [Pirellulaceae bacterium]
MNEAEQNLGDLILGWHSEDQPSKELLAQLAMLDVPALQKLARGEQKAQDWAALAAKAQPPTAFRAGVNGNAIGAAAAIEAGEELLAAGKVAMILVAGGQGTRLGFPQPKGLFPIGPVSGRTLFEIVIDRLKAMSRKYGVSIPLLVMTSPATDEETAKHFELNQNFGLSDDQLTLFCQGTMPALDQSTGKLLLQEKNRLFLSPNGHGGMLDALVDSGCFEKVSQCGIEHFFYGQIDNPLVQVCDPELLGYHALSQSEMTTQVVQKSNPLEKVGNVVEIDGQVQIIEYSDLPEEFALRKNAEGGMSLWAGNIAVHVFSGAFLKRTFETRDALPFHLANKKVSYRSTGGELIEPIEPNAIKFEKFIFDLLPLAKNAIAVEVRKSDGFAPVKNADGAASDTPELARQAISDLHRGWLMENGVSIAENVRIEIHPEFALNADQLAQKELPQSIETDTFLCGEAS